MRELSVYYCPHCGRYGYYNLVKNTVCPNCNVKMILLNMKYQKFMDLNREERDNLIIHKLLLHNHSLTGRLIAADRAHNYRAAIASLTSQIEELETANKELNHTITWMHQTIWDLLNKNKSLEHQLADLMPKPPQTNQH